MDLLFSNNKKIKRPVIVPLVITFSPANQNFRKWIAEEINNVKRRAKIIIENGHCYKTGPKY